MNPQDLPKGPSIEAPISGKAANQPGVYLHEGSGNTVIVMPDSKSTGQQDALVRLGFVWQSPPPTRDQLHAMQTKQAVADGAKPDEAHSGNFGKYDPDAKRYNATSTNTGEGSDNMSTDVQGTDPAQADPTPATPADAPAPPAEESADADESSTETQTNAPAEESAEEGSSN